MIVLQHFEISDAAQAVLERRQSNFRPTASSVLALAYLAKNVERDGTTAKGFAPGFAIFGWLRSNLSADCATVSLGKNGELFLIPRAPWNVEARYLMDLLSPEHETFSIVPGGR